MGRITDHLDPQCKLTRYLNDSAGDRLRTRIVETARQRAVGEDISPTEWGREGEYEGTHYRFDRAGNLVRRRDSERDLHLIWDANQRLTESHSNGVVTHYGYDPLGRRLFKETGGRRTCFYWDGDALVGEAVVETPMTQAEQSSPPVTIASLSPRRKNLAPQTSIKSREYLYYPETFEPLALVDGVSETRQTYHYHNDPNGCPVRLTDNKGNVKWAATYTVWGKISELYINQVDNPIRLQGQRDDPETGLSYNRHRYYDASIGAFASEDPAGLFGGDSLTTLGVNALEWIDPLGLKCSKITSKNGKMNRPGFRGGWLV